MKYHEIRNKFDNLLNCSLPVPLDGMKINDTFMPKFSPGTRRFKRTSLQLFATLINEDENLSDTLLLGRNLHS